MLAAVAFVPTPPLLVPEIAGGSASADESLRKACHAAVARLVASDVDEVVVVGSASTREVSGSWDWRGFGVASPVQAPAVRLPLPLAIGDWLLDAQPGAPPRRFAGVPDLPAADCIGLGADIVSGDRRVGLLVCGDGTACRSEKAPGFNDADAEPWDDAAVAALRNADARGLLDLDAALARRLLTSGRGPWQVLAGAAGSDLFTAAVDYADAPYGVMYVVGTWTR